MGRGIPWKSNLARCNKTQKVPGIGGGLGSDRWIDWGIYDPQTMKGSPHIRRRERDRSLVNFILGNST